METLETGPPGRGGAPVELVAEAVEGAGGRLKVVDLTVRGLATGVLEGKVDANKLTAEVVNVEEVLVASIEEWGGKGMFSSDKGGTKSWAFMSNLGSNVGVGRIDGIGDWVKAAVSTTEDIMEEGCEH